MTANEPLWTIDELGAQVALALSVDYEGPPNSRVREVPDRRTIRYYTTLGLLDRPAELRGRTALYGRRHLMQLVTIKRLQARGLSLTAIQQELLGLTDPALARLARLPDLAANASAGTARTEAAPERRTDSFWAAAPAPVAEAGAGQDEADQTAAEARTADVPWQGVSLGDGVLLLLEPARPVEEDDSAALRVAAAPLLKLLEARRLLRPRQERGIS